MQSASDSWPSFTGTTHSTWGNPYEELLAAAIAVGAAVSIAVPAHAAPSTVLIRKADFVPQLSDTRATGHYEFLREGLAVYTEGATSTDKVAEYWSVTGALPTTASLEWTGTDAQPGVQVVFDVDGVTGNGNDYNVLVGEKVYGNDWWLTSSSSAAAKAAAPQTTGGFGSPWHGTLAEWRTALPSAKQYAGGFSLGSGVKGAGLLRAVTFGEVTYEFTDTPVVTPPATPATIDVTGSADVTKADRKVKVILVSNKLAANQVEGKLLTWKIKVDGKTGLKATQGAGERDVFKQRFAKHTGKHVVEVFKNGSSVAKVKIKTG